MSDIEAKLRLSLVTELDKKKADLELVSEEVSSLEAKLGKFDEIFGTSEPTTTAPKTAKKTAKKGPKTAKKTDVSAEATDATDAKASTTLAAQGRREVASGSRPKIKDAMVMVMGTTVMNADTILAELTTRGWLPNSNKPKTYISYLLSSLKDTFEKIPGQRGNYRVRTASDASTDSSEAAPASEDPAVEAGVTTTEEDDTDSLLADVGLIDLEPTKAAAHAKAVSN